MEQVSEEIERAHVICIVFSVDRPETLSKISTYWLPFVRDSLGSEFRKPVILVGNKIDLIDYSIIDVSIFKEPLRSAMHAQLLLLVLMFFVFQNIWDIAEEYPEVDRCIECSAKTLMNVSEMFYNAQKAVLHPIGPIYCIEEQEVSFIRFFR